MMNPASWVTASTVQIFGWTLVHFIWEGVALAAILYVVLAFCRTALARYSAALGTLVLMVCSPLATSFFLAHRGESAFHGLPPFAGAANAALTVPAATPVSTAVLPFDSPGWLTWFVLFWCAGVLVFAIRALGGWFVLQRLRREKAYQLPEGLRQRCLALQRRMGLSRTVRYFESRHLDSAAVVGWFRPVILLPVTALTGLSPQQLEAVIVHELAHIKRLDCFVNLFQIAAETLLFYHPAVWWVNRCIRADRENCCDDIAVSVCGDAYEYARALTLMETWRATPALVLAANSGSLKLRISRLLGFRAMTHSAPRAGLGIVGLVCAAGALLAGSTFNRTFSHLSEFEPSTLQEIEQNTTPVASEPAPPLPVLAPSTEQTDTVATRATATVALTTSAQTAVTTSEDRAQSARRNSRICPLHAS
jgi:beta-lactamase regulating signal transducer with metallopeptidase domain